ncbi:MAG: glycosyltransferase [Clostridia bacterium]|nr:glycosyltransferase [Clostridia bacterium]
MSKKKDGIVNTEVTEVDTEGDDIFDAEARYSNMEDVLAELDFLYYDADKLDREELAVLCKRQRAEIEKLKKHYSLALEQLDISRRQCIDYKNMYDSVASSTVWKLTKPIRLLLDIIKWPFKQHPIRKAIKFFKHVRKYGWRSALSRVRQRLGERAHARNITHTITASERNRQLKTRFSKDIKFSILVPLYNTPLEFLDVMIDSVQKQTYFNWELCLADGSDDAHAEVGRTCVRYAKHDERIKYKKLDENLGISLNTNACIEMATGDYIALFDHDDVLHPSALYEMMVAICDEGADYVYTDEVTFESPDITKIISVHYKPDFAPDNLRANNYICHFSAFSREVLEKSGLFRKEFDGSQDHDLILRLTSNAKKIVHIPKVLYFWRSHPMSVAMDINSKTYAIEAGKGAVRSFIESKGMSATVDSTKVFPAMYRISYDIKDNPKVSIVIIDCHSEKHILRCLESIRSRTAYSSYEVIYALSSSQSKFSSTLDELVAERMLDAVIKCDTDEASALFNEAARGCTGDYLLFLEGGAEIISNNWITELLMYAQRDDVGICAGTLYYPDNTVRHAGYVIGNGKDGIVARMFHKIHNTSVGYMGRLWYSQNLSAVSCEMMMIKRSLFDELSGFDTELRASYYDVDLCLRARKSNRIIVWTPYAAAYALVSPRAKQRRDVKSAVADASRIKKRWGDVISSSDPYYNKNFSAENADFSM